MNRNVEKFQRYMEKYHRLIAWNVKKYAESALKEDIVQETLAKMYEHIEYLNDDNIFPWLMTVSRNLAIDYKKKGGRFSGKIVPLEDIREELEKEQYPKSAEEAIGENWEMEELRMFLKKAGDLLYRKNPKWYFILIDAVLLGMSSKEMAESLGMNVVNVDTMRCRARKYMKKHLGTEAEKYL